MFDPERVKVVSELRDEEYVLVNDSAFDSDCVPPDTLSDWLRVADAASDALSVELNDGPVYDRDRDGSALRDDEDERE